MKKMSVFTQYAHLTVEEFDEVVTLGTLERQAYLAEHQMDESDFEAWKQVMISWQNSDALVFDEAALFGDVVRGAYIADLEKNTREQVS